MKSCEKHAPYTYMMDTYSLVVELRNRLGRGWFFEATIPEAKSLDRALNNFRLAHETEDDRQAHALVDHIPMEAL